METLAEGAMVVVPVGPAVELKQDLDVRDILTPVDTSLTSMLFSSVFATWIISGLFVPVFGENENIIQSYSYLPNK